MWTKLAGYLSIVLALLWIIWPGLLRGWFVRRTGREALWVALGLSIFFFTQCLALVQKLPAGPVRSAGSALVVAAAVVLWVTQSQARQKIRQACEKAPLEAFRLFGWIQLAAGLGLVLLKK